MSSTSSTVPCSAASLAGAGRCGTLRLCTPAELGAVAREAAALALQTHTAVVAVGGMLLDAASGRGVVAGVGQGVHGHKISGFSSRPP